MQRPKFKKFNSTGVPVRPRRLEHARAPIIILLLAGIIVGFCAGAFWLTRSTAPDAGKTTSRSEQDAVSNLSESSRAVLRNLDSPVQIHFYAVLDPSSVPDSTRAFASRAGRLLSQFEQESKGKVTVTRYESLSDSSAEEASVDGVRPFNLDKGTACYLGLAVLQGNRSEPLPRLAPEWEAALESDVTRAIVRATHAPFRPQQTEAQSAAAAEALLEIERSIPNLASVSVEDGTRSLRESALEDFISTVKNTEAQINAVQQRLNEMQHNASAADRQAVMEQLQELRAEQKEQISDIALQLQDRIDALEQVKGVVEQPTTAGKDGLSTRPTR